MTTHRGKPRSPERPASRTRPCIALPTRDPYSYSVLQLYKTLQLRAAARYSGRGMLDLVLQYRLQDFEYKHIKIQ